MVILCFLASCGGTAGAEADGQAAEDAGNTRIAGIVRDYKEDTFISHTDIAIEWPWEELEPFEQYTKVTIDGTDYYASYGAYNIVLSLDEAQIGESIGSYEAEGYDSYAEQTHRLPVEVYRITGIDPEHMIAVQIEEQVYPFSAEEAKQPETLGELFDTYSLPENLRFAKYAECKGYEEGEYFELNDDEPIYEILRQCASAPKDPSDMIDLSEKEYISFTATSNALGVYKKVVYVTKDGYFWTNIFGPGYTYRIGEEAAERILSYAGENSVKAEPETYLHSVSGIVTEKAETFFLLDDSILCKDPEKGMVFKVSTEDLRIRRAADHSIEAGDAAVVYFTDRIDTENENLVMGATEVIEGTLTEP